jgi:hypothetical protein
LTPRKASPDQLQLIHINSQGVTTFLAGTPLDPFIGVWLEAYEKITYNSAGQYSILIRRVSDGAALFSYSNDNLDLWRTGTTVVRPKWGIYRSLNHPVQLRDEQVRFDRFCLAKGTDDCVSDQTLPDFVLSSTNAQPEANRAGQAFYVAHVEPLRDFSGDVALSVLDLPPGVSAEFHPEAIPAGGGGSSLSVSIPRDTPAGSYPLVIYGVSGSLSHALTIPLTVPSP